MAIIYATGLYTHKRANIIKVRHFYHYKIFLMQKINISFNHTRHSSIPSIAEKEGKTGLYFELMGHADRCTAVLSIGSSNKGSGLLTCDRASLHASSAVSNGAHFILSQASQVLAVMIPNTPVGLGVPRERGFHTRNFKIVQN